MHPRIENGGSLRQQPVRWRGGSESIFSKCIKLQLISTATWHWEGFVGTRCLPTHTVTFGITYHIQLLVSTSPDKWSEGFLLNLRASFLGGIFSSKVSVVLRLNSIYCTSATGGLHIHWIWFLKNMRWIYRYMWHVYIWGGSEVDSGLYLGSNFSACHFTLGRLLFAFWEGGCRREWDLEG